MAELPKFHETFLPILETLKDGEVMHYRDLQKKVRDKYYMNLPEDLLNQKTSTGANVLLDRISWGKVFLKQGEFLSSPERGLVQITNRGKQVLKDGHLTLQEIRKDDVFLANRKKTNIEKVNEVSIDNSSPQELIDSGILVIEAQTKADLLERLKKIDPYYFEKVILILLNKMGYGEFIETKKSGDGGIDGIVNQDKLGLEKIYVQAKRYANNKVHETEIRNFIGAMSGDTNKGIFVTTSDFDNSAIQKAHDAIHKIILINGEKMVDLMYEYGVGVQIKNTYETKEVDEDFFEEN